MLRRTVRVAALAAAAALVPATAQAALSSVATDPFTNASSQHATIVEPDTFGFGSTIVAAGQSGRFFNGGASGIAFATSSDNGTSWTSGVLPNLTVHNGNEAYTRTTDPSVAYDPKHGVWMVSSLPLLDDALGNPAGVGVLVSRSTDGGLTWGNPVPVATATGRADFDKNWTACDTTASSPYYGNCYTTFDDYGDGDRIKMSTSTDGGLTWGPARNTADNATGLGGQPVVRPNGTVVVPAANANESAIIAFTSTDGGASWSATTTVSTVANHTEAGNLRSGPLPSAEIDGAGTTFVAWSDCRFRKGCKGNDIVVSASANGTSWSAPRSATDPRSGADYFIPGLAVDRTTSGAAAKLGIAYHAYATSACRKTCRIEAGYVQSGDAGTTWTAPTQIVAPASVSLAPDTSQGRMVGDYISTSFNASGVAVPALVQPRTPLTTAFDQPLLAGPVVPGSTTAVFNASGFHPVAAAASDHASARSPIRRR